MSDLLLLQQGAHPWLPADNVTPHEILNEYDIPLSGLIEQSGATYLFVCLLGELEELNIWAYSHLSETEAAHLGSLLEDDLSAAIDEALANRMLVVALAHDCKLVDWVRLDAGLEGPLALPAKIDAVSYGLSLVHEDTRYLREQSDIHTAAMERQETRLDRHGELLGSLSERLGRHGELLEQILRRLPAEPV